MTKLGVNVPNFGAGANPDELRRWARSAADAGISLVMVSDHVAITPDVHAKYPAPFYDPFTLLGWLAGSTPEIEIGTTVTIVPYRHPLLTAQLSVNLHKLSGGRFTLGVGAGWSEPEYTALGVPFAERGKLTDAHLDTIADFFRHESINFEGQRVHTGANPADPPPIWVGGDSRTAINRAARIGDAWHPLDASAAWLAGTGLPRLNEAADKRERPIPDFAPRTKIRPTETSLSERRTGEGSLQQILDDLKRLDELGATYLVLDPDDAETSRRDYSSCWPTVEKLAEAIL
jgi:probable F420-dependent oxidoreductase